MVDFKKQGKANRAKGARFELQTRKDLEEKGFIVDKWSNNVDLDNSCLIPAKMKFMHGKPLSAGTGFPDFIAIYPVCRGRKKRAQRYNVIFVECKCNGTLSKIEKLKMEWLHGEGFECWIASKNGKLVEYARPGKVRRKNPKY